MNYVLTIDEGTTSTRALLISAEGQILDIVQKDITQYYPQAGWVEHNPIEIWEKTLACCREIIIKNLAEKKITKESISSIAITNQRETTIIWSARSGKPIYNAIVWQCRRTAERCEELKKTKLSGVNFTDYIKSKTGLLVDAYFSATKIEWILKDQSHNELIFGTIDTWLVWNLTLGRDHLTDASNASRTMLYNIHEDKWDLEILKHLNISPNILPKVIESNGDFGSSPLFSDLLGREIPIKAVLGDQQAAFYAYNGEAKCTYGTGTFVMLPYGSPVHGQRSTVNGNEETRFKVGDQRDVMSFSIVNDNEGLLKSSGYKTQSEKALVLEGSIFVGGSIVQWLRDELNFLEKSSDIEALANSVPDNGGVYLIPALAGLGAPYWRGDVRGTIFGMTRGTNKAHIAKAALESIAYRVRDIIEALDPKLRSSITQLNVDGGASKNNTLMQFQADLLQIPIQRYTETEMTALGVAKMTGEVRLKLQAETVFQPQANLDENYKVWKKYIAKLLS
jgi:glycerol kinase